jgi:hypothetical protein
VARPPFKLITSSSHQSTDTQKCLHQLLKESESKELIGLAYVAMYKDREWDYRACGEANRNPAWSLSMLFAFMVKLANDINKG